MGVLDWFRAPWLLAVFGAPWWQIVGVFLISEGVCIWLTWRDRDSLPDPDRRHELAISYIPLAVIASIRIPFGPISAFAFIYVSVSLILWSIVIGSGLHPAVLGTVGSEKPRDRRTRTRFWSMSGTVACASIALALTAIANPSLISHIR